MKLKKKEERKLKARRKLRMKINEIENRKRTCDIIESKSQYCEEINKIDNPSLT